MRLTVHPQSLWLAYDMRRVAEVQDMLPATLRVAPVRLLDSDAIARPRLLLNAYDVSSRWMNGARIEVQTLVEHRAERTVHLCILDCLTDTMQWDPTDGVRRGNALRHERRARPPFKLSLPGAPFTMNITSPERNPALRTTLLRVSGRVGRRVETLTRRFAVDANRVCYFHRMDTRFPMKFREEEVLAPVRRLACARVDTPLWRRYRATRRPTHAFVHEGPMRFDVDVPGMWYDV
jgi:hypothetical protein